MKKLKIQLTIIIVTLLIIILPSNTFALFHFEEGKINIPDLLNEDRDKVYLGVAEVCKIALYNNFDIQLAKFNVQSKRADLAGVKSIFDTMFEAETKFKEDEKKRTSTFAGTESESNIFNFGLSKKFSTGTKVKVNFDTERSWTNSGYSTINPAHESVAEISLTQELGKNFFGIQDRSKIKITKLEIENAEYTSLSKIEGMIARVKKVYWRTVLYLEIVKIRKEMLERAKKLYSINKDRIKRGLIEKPQLLSSQANVEQKKVDLKLAQNHLSSLLNEMKFLLNLDERDKIVVPKENFSLQKTSPVGLKKALKNAFKNRRDYQEAKNNVGSNNVNLVMKRNNLFPEINLEASIARNGLEENYSDAIESMSTEDNPEYFLGLKITFPLENRKAESDYKKAQINRSKSLLQLKRVEQEIVVDIKDAVRNVGVYRERLRRQKKIVKLQESKLKQEIQKYKHGRSDTDTVIRYQNDLLSAKLLYKKAFLQYKHSLIELSQQQDTLLNSYWEGEL